MQTRAPLNEGQEPPDPPSPRATVPEALAIVLSGVVVLFVAGLPTTAWLRIEVAAAAALAIALTTRRRPVRRRVAMAGAAALLLVTTLRLVGFGTADEALESRTRAHVPLARAVDEEDGVQLATRLAGDWIMTDRERTGFADALHTRYSALRERRAMPPTPLTATLMGLQSPDSFDVIRPREPNAPAGTLVFFHGAAGNWALLCALVGDAAADVGFATRCPSTDFRGRWDEARSREVARRAIAAARDERPGLPLVLAGLSNGAATAHAAVDEARRTGEIAGVLMLYGVDERVPADVPAAIVYGAHDQRFRAASVRRVATQWEREERDVRLWRISADHFGLVKAHDETARAIREALAAWRAAD